MIPLRQQYLIHKLRAAAQKNDDFELGMVRDVIKEIQLTYPKKKAVVISSQTVSGPYAQDIRDRKIERIDVFFK